MRLVPMTEATLKSLRAQWKRDVESSGEDFSTYALGPLAAFDAAAADPGKSGIYGLFEQDKVHALCQVSRFLMSRYASPVLRARFATFAPSYDLGGADLEAYAQTMVALFSGVLWLSKDTLAAKHIRFLLRSPGDAQFFAALQIATPISPFSAFTIKGAWIECTLKATSEK